MAFAGVGGTAAAAAAADKLIEDDDEDQKVSRRLGLTPRQQVLDRRWAYYRCDQYAPRKVAWDGSRVVGQSEFDMISLAGFVPPGFYVADSATIPIQFRRPSTPYHLCKVIVDRFTSLLFGQKRHPKISVEGDEDTEQFVNAVVEEGRLWAAMMQARCYGGATGTAVIGFKLLQGRPQFEVFDPRWCQPKFVDRSNLVLDSLEYRHTFKQEVIDPESGNLVEVDFWYRRVIDSRRDVIFEPVRVERNRPPVWVPATEVPHNLGFCPIVWIQNQPGDTEIDGDPDCMGIYDLAEAIDRLNSQGERGILANCDPTVVLTTDAQMSEVKKGSNNAMKLPANSSAGYMEMSGAGIVQAREQVKIYKDLALEVAQCVLEQPDGQKTATEVERNFAAMLARADTFREQYGELGVKRLVNMVLVAAAQLTRPRLSATGVTRFEIRLPKRKDGRDQKLGSGPYQVTLQWPAYFEPSLADANMAVQAATGAKVAELVDAETATKFIAPYFQVEDPTAVAKQARGPGAETQADIERMALEGAQPDQLSAAVPETGKAQDVALNGAQVTALSDLITAVNAGQVPAVSAIEIILLGFPIDRKTAERMVAGQVAPPTAALEPEEVKDAPG